ncbi:MAG TPA: hypothetical protein VFV90_10840 [Usitatibacter sp.]|nr:hypothetical protein [Usitatibacter sp.]
MRSAHVLAGSLLAAMGSVANDDVVSVREHVAIVSTIAASFAALAGGDENAVGLVEALRAGIPVNLSYPGPKPRDLPRVIAIEPPTGRMDWSDVRMALMLTRDALTSVGVLRPSGEQLHAALLGGEVPVPGDRVVAFKGVLRMRADGRNWGAVASERFQRAAITRIE